jgi:hypothetical protein
MDPTLLIGIVLIAVYVLYRLRYAKRKSGWSKDQGLEIQRKLDELRKKRDEE